MDSYNNKPIHNILILILFSVLLTSCEQSFQPFETNDRYHFSVYGWIDASADTQWIRIMPVRESFFLSPEPIDATVTLLHEESGTTVTMKDSLFQFGDEAYAWNFYTDFDVEPSQSYRLTIENSSGDTSVGRVTLPENFPTPLVLIDITTTFQQLKRDTVYVDNVKQLVDVRTVYRLKLDDRDFERVVTFAHLQDTTRQTPESYLVSLDPNTDIDILDRDFENYSVISKQIFIASAGPGWPHFGTLNRNIAELPEGVSNIEGGVGFFGGIVSKTIPYMSCFEDGDTETEIPCPLENPEGL